MKDKALKIQPIITTGYRPIKNGSAYDKYFPKVKMNDKMVVSNQSANVDDVVAMMQKVVWKYLGDTKQIATKLQGTTTKQSIINIWNFLYHHIQYKLDTPGLEELRRPARLWHDKEGDCDDYAMSASSILTNLKIPHSFRITKYGGNQFQHVYIIIPKAKGYYIIDPVLSRANYEKPFTEKKDFNMNLNGINVAVLEGFGNTDSNIIEDMLLNDLDLQGLGSLSDKQADQRMYKYLVSTREFAIKNKGSVANYDNPESFIKSLDYALKYWNTPRREEALSILERNEEKENQINTDKGLLSGFEDDYDDGWDDLDGLSDELAEQYLRQDEIDGFGSWRSWRKRRKNGKVKRKTRRKKFWGKVKKGLKKVGKTLNRYNPAVAAIRGGILIAMRINMFGFKKRLKWAYATDSQLEKARIKKSYALKSKKVLTKIERIFEGMGGKRKNLKKAILKGKKGQLTGVYDEQYSEEELEGLGVISSAAMLTAATTVLGLISKIFKKNKLGKEEKVILNSTQERNGHTSNKIPNTAVSRKRYSSNGAEDGAMDYDIERDTTTDVAKVKPDAKPPNRFVKILKDNPLYAAIGGVSILGLSAWGISSFMKSKKANPKTQTSIAGHSNSKSSKRKSRKPKAKASPVLKIEKLI
jgi:hypothetical protein